MYWAQELAAQTADKDLQTKFAPLAKALTENEKKIVDELKAVQGKPVEIGGYYKPSLELLEKVMCPSTTFNTIIQSAKA
jgi:isocitrate dehydrogenase